MGLTLEWFCGYFKGFYELRFLVKDDRILNDFKLILMDKTPKSTESDIIFKFLPKIGPNNVHSLCALPQPVGASKVSFNTSVFTLMSRWALDRPIMFNASSWLKRQHFDSWLRHQRLKMLLRIFFKCGCTYCTLLYLGEILFETFILLYFFYRNYKWNMRFIFNMEYLIEFAL